MGKLSNLKPRLGSLPPRVGYAPGDERGRDRHRSQSQHWRKWYHSAEWKRLRQRVFLRDLYTCQMCGRVEGNTSKLIGDHKTPHRGDRAMFFSDENVWTLCKSCHDGEKQKLERSQGFR